MSNEIQHDCPACGSSRIADIFYGYMDVSAIADDLASGRIVLGGSSLSASSPKWRCNTCGHEWGDFEAVFQEWELRRAEERARFDGEARARGVMETSLYPDGWILCPHCGRSFSSESRQSWDGERHVTCGTYLRLLT